MPVKRYFSADLKIKRKLQLHTAVAVLFGLLFFLVLYHSQKILRTALVVERQLYRIEHDAQQLALLSYEMPGNPKEKRAREQWRIIYFRLDQCMRDIPRIYDVPDIQLKSLKYQHVRLGKLYDQLSALPESNPSAGYSEDFSRKKRDQLVAAITVNVQNIVSVSARIREDCRTEQEQRLQRAQHLSLTAAVLIIFFFMLSAFLSGRSIFLSIAALHNGISRVARGDLDHPVSLKTRDELGEFAGAFNQMLLVLRETMAGRDLLDREVRERQQTEKKLHEYQDGLEQKVKERTEDLTRSRLAAISIMEDAELQRHEAEQLSQQLQQEILVKKEQEKLLREQETVLRETARKAEAANRAKSIFLANMSHELRTPLNAVLGFSQLMQTNPDIPETEQEHLQIINRSGHHLLSLINAVLDMSKIESGQVELEPVSFDLRELVDDLITMMRRRAEKKGLYLLAEYCSDLPRYIHADVSKLRQILLNLLGNAVNYTAEGGVILRVNRKSDDKGTALKLFFEVEDSGAGIAPDEQQRIFHPFVQGGAPGEQAGTGLGLTITRQYAELMGGEICLESKADRGSVFRVSLPVQRGDETNVVKAEASRRGTVRLAPGQGEQRVLIVEDNRDNRLLLQNLLKPVGFSVHEATNGAEALAVFQEWRPHFIWMDIRMPIMDGCEATRRIRALPGGEAVKIVALTASAFREQRRRIQEAGCDEVLCKPFRPPEIFKSMKDHLKLRYIYDQEAQEDEQVAPSTPLTAAMTTELPDEQKKALRAAAQKLDISTTEEVLKKIRNEHPEIAGRLQVLAREFRFGQILELLDNERKTS